MPNVCLDRWEKLIQENNRATGRNEYSSFLKTYQAYNRLLSDFNAVKATIICLMYRIVYEDIQFLRRKGYAIALTNSQAYEKSLLAAIEEIG